MNRNTNRIICLCGAAVSWAAGTVGAAPLGTAFNYQGQLKRDGAPVTGTCDFRAQLWSAPQGGSAISPGAAINDVPITNGLVSFPIDFGADYFDGSALWLQLAVDCVGSGLFYPLG